MLAPGALARFEGAVAKFALKLAEPGVLVKQVDVEFLGEGLDGGADQPGIFADDRGSGGGRLLVAEHSVAGGFDEHSLNGVE